jgi:hypothetical protein
LIGSPREEEGRKSQQQVNGKDDQHQSDYKMNGFILKYSHNFTGGRGSTFRLLI